MKRKDGLDRYIEKREKEHPGFKDMVERINMKKFDSVEGILKWARPLLYPEALETAEYLARAVRIAQAFDSAPHGLADMSHDEAEDIYWALRKVAEGEDK